LGIEAIVGKETGSVRASPGTLPVHTEHLANVRSTTCGNRGNTPEELDKVKKTPRYTFKQLVYESKNRFVSI